MEKVSTIRLKTQKAIWMEFDRITDNALKQLLETFMEEERDQMLACGRYERSRGRQGYRNGYESRFLETRKGRIRLRVPRVRGREAPLRSLVFDAYQRRSRDIEEAVEHWIAAGQSTRVIEQSLQLAFDCMFSASTISRILAKVDRELAVFHRRSLGHGYKVIFLDAKHGDLCRRRRSGRRGKKKKGVLLTCWGIRHEGTEELVDFMACEGGESEENWTRFLTQLQQRGLKRRNPWQMPLEIIATDGDGGLEAALLTVYPHVPKQRCVFHKVQAIARHLRNQENRKAILASASAIYERIRTPQEARANLQEWVTLWQQLEPYAVKNFCEDFERTLLYLHLSKEMWSRVRTTNPLERFHLELERAAGHVGAWQHRKSWERHVFVIWRRLKRSGYQPVRAQKLFTRNS